MQRLLFRFTLDREPGASTDRLSRGGPHTAPPSRPTRSPLILPSPTEPTLAASSLSASHKETPTEAALAARATRIADRTRAVAASAPASRPHAPRRFGSASRTHPSPRAFPSFPGPSLTGRDRSPSHDAAASARPALPTDLPLTASEYGALVGALRTAAAAAPLLPGTRAAPRVTVAPSPATLPTPAFARGRDSASTAAPRDADGLAVTFPQLLRAARALGLAAPSVAAFRAGGGAATATLRTADALHCLLPHLPPAGIRRCVTTYGTPPPVLPGAELDSWHPRTLAGSTSAVPQTFGAYGGGLESDAHAGGSGAGGAGTGTHADAAALDWRASFTLAQVRELLAIFRTFGGRVTPAEDLAIRTLPLGAQCDAPWRVDLPPPGGDGVGSTGGSGGNAIDGDALGGLGGYGPTAHAQAEGSVRGPTSAHGLTLAQLRLAVSAALLSGPCVPLACLGASAVSHSLSPLALTTETRSAHNNAVRFSLCATKQGRRVLLRVALLFLLIVVVCSSSGGGGGGHGDWGTAAPALGVAVCARAASRGSRLQSECGHCSPHNTEARLWCVSLSVSPQKTEVHPVRTACPELRRVRPPATNSSRRTYSPNKTVGIFLTPKSPSSSRLPASACLRIDPVVPRRLRNAVLRLPRPGLASPIRTPPRSRHLSLSVPR